MNTLITILAIYLAIGALIAMFILSFVSADSIIKGVLAFILITLLWPAMIPVAIYLFWSIP